MAPIEGEALITGQVQVSTYDEEATGSCVPTHLCCPTHTLVPTAIQSGWAGVWMRPAQRSAM